MMRVRNAKVQMKDGLFMDEGVTCFQLLYNVDFGMATPGVVAFARMSVEGTGAIRSTTITHAINRLIECRTELSERAVPETVFSPIATKLKEYFKPFALPTTLNAEAVGYGCFQNKAAMISLMLACSEIEVVRSCGSFIKTLINAERGAEGLTDTLARIISTLQGYEIAGALGDPLSTGNIPFVNSRISTGNLGSLASAWLATHSNLTFRQLLTAGEEVTQAFVAYSRVFPFLQAVLGKASQRQGGYGQLASIACVDVQAVFFDYALVLINSLPAHTDSGTSVVLSEVDEMVVTSLFYGAMSTGSLSASREAIFITHIVAPQDAAGVELGNPHVDLGPAAP
jgi:hypothetical protein